MEKILIVEDHTDLRKLLALALRKYNRSFFHTNSGEEALDIARRERPDVILLDAKLAGAMDGYETARRLRSQPETKNLPILFLSTGVLRSDRARAFSAGADTYIEKPFKLAFLKEQIEVLIQSQTSASGEQPSFRVAEDPPRE